MKRLTTDTGIEKWGFMFNELGYTLPIPFTLAVNWKVLYFYFGAWIPFTRFHFNMYAIKHRGFFINFHKIFSFETVHTAGGGQSSTPPSGTIGTPIHIINHRPPPPRP
jgi:hypothetical protein